MNEKQANIYNQYLKAIAKVNDRPYKLRKNFEKLDKDSLTTLYRLEVFFDQFKHVSPYIFFLAYLEIKELKYAKLSDYLHHSAIVAYSKYNNIKYDEYIDSDKSLNYFIEGVRFIIGFCIANKLPTELYRTAVNENNIPLILIHLNEQKISYYHLHALDVSRTQLETDYTEILFNDFNRKFSETKQKYINSNKLKEIGNKLGKRINKLS